MERRQYIKAAGGIGTVASIGGLALTGGASANQTYSIDGTSVTIDDGDLSYVDVSLSSTLSWDGFDTPVKYLRFTSEIQITGNKDGTNTNPHPLITDNVSDELPGEWKDGKDGDGSGKWGGSDEYYTKYTGDTKGTEGEIHTAVDWRVIGQNGKSIEDPVDWTDQFEPTDGTQKKVQLKKKSTTEMLDENNTVISHDAATVESTETFTVTVNNQQSTNGGSASGDSTAG